MEHYFSRTPHTPHKINRIHCSFFGRTFSFATDASVFSRKRVDFGTRLLILSSKVEQIDRLLDLGCGYGVVGIVLSSLCAKVVLVDVNERACELAKINVRENHVRNARVICGSLGDVPGAFDAILFNPPIRAGKKVYMPLIEMARGQLSERGRLYVVARTAQGAKSIYTSMCEIYEAEYVAKKAGYRVIVGAASLAERQTL
jgi:16S rRNA (guanine1207-N2)-methyltransferase